MSSQPFMVNPRQVARPLVFALLLSVFTATHVSHAYGQSFTLTPSALSPPTGVNPGDTATATVAVESTGGFSGSVSLSCSVTSNQFTTGLPQCLVSPLDVTPDAVASLTISTTGGTQGTQAGLYTIAVTGTSGSISQTATLALNVTDVTEDYTLSVLPTTATPSPVTAGNVATTTVTVSPVGSYSGHQVTLACLSVTPVVAAAPICSFTPTNGTSPGSVQITQGPATATLTITTLGPKPTTRLSARRIFYALWLLVPGLALAGAAGPKDRSKKLMGLLLLVAVSIGLLQFFLQNL